MSDRAFIAQLEGYGLTTAEILYDRPDAPSLLQLFVWQEHDLAPDFRSFSNSSIIGGSRSGRRSIR